MRYTQTLAAIALGTVLAVPAFGQTPTLREASPPRKRGPAFS
jgi:hypothetical protein